MHEIIFVLCCLVQCTYSSALDGSSMIITYPFHFYWLWLQHKHSKFYSIVASLNKEADKTITCDLENYCQIFFIVIKSWDGTFFVDKPTHDGHNVWYFLEKIQQWRFLWAPFGMEVFLTMYLFWVLCSTKCAADIEWLVEGFKLGWDPLPIEFVICLIYTSYRNKFTSCPRKSLVMWNLNTDIFIFNTRILSRA